MGDGHSREWGGQPISQISRNLVTSRLGLEETRGFVLGRFSGTFPLIKLLGQNVSLFSHRNPGGYLSREAFCVSWVWKNTGKDWGLLMVGGSLFGKETLAMVV